MDSYSKTRSNPFVVAGKIPASLFCDREKETERLTREITNGNNLVLISSRRMGKTGLIQHCFDLSPIKDNYETFYLDILQTTSLKEFTYLLGKEIFQRLASRSEKRLKKFMSVLRSLAGSFGFDPFNGTPTFNIKLGDIEDPELTLDEIFRYIGQADTSSIIAIDEFQQIVKYKEKNVEAILRSHIQKLQNVNFIFAGSERHLLQEMFNESARPFFNSASMLTLAPIEISEYINFATKLFGAANKILDPEVVEYVYKAFDGNTFYLQKTFNLAFSMTMEGKSCGLRTVKDAIDEMLTSYDTIYREILSETTDSQKQLLIAVAREGEAASITSAKFIKRNALPSASSVQSAAKRLLESYFITRNATVYRIQDPLFRQWILRTYL